MQKNWIGKSFGCEIEFKIEGDLPVDKIKCFTTRPDTLFGFSFLALSADHEISNFIKIIKILLNLRKNVQKLGQPKKQLLLLKKDGFKTNLKAINPFKTR